MDHPSSHDSEGALNMQPDPAAIEAGRKLFARESRFATAATDVANLPKATLPEIAFAGRSNVGKSSLINALTGRKALARTSRTPGRTQQLNFFDLGGRLMLVDLPGYGFAQAPKTAVIAWTQLIDGYLRGRTVLNRTMLLVDARVGLKDSDRQAMDVLDRTAVTYQIVLTKIDKLKKPELDDVRRAVGEEAARHVAAHPDMMAVSAQDGVGIPELRAVLAGLAQPAAETNR
ncbi:MAG TPA: ribosome biogenesis GTP-binding protein YihA/YsxC [Magnetospirillaceae bacterium]|jgi:GTP-binding protein